MIRDSSVSMVTGWTTEVRHVVQIGPGAHPASLCLVSSGSWLKWPVMKLTTSSAEIKNAWSLNPITPYVRLHGVVFRHRGSFAFYLLSFKSIHCR